MKRQETNGLVYYHFESLNVPHGIFTRLGGVSTGHLTSLNVGALVGDDPINITTNRKRMLAALGMELDTVRTVWQVHSATVLVANEQGPGRNGTRPIPPGVAAGRPGGGSPTPPIPPPHRGLGDANQPSAGHVTPGPDKAGPAGGVGLTGQSDVDGSAGPARGRAPYPPNDHEQAG